jgi:Membrane-fusion protein
MFDTNETVGAGMPVIAMIASGSPEVEIHIPLADYIRQDEFDSFTCTVDVYPGVSFPAQLIGMNQKANVNQLYNTRLRVKSVDGKTPGPGMSATVTIIYRKGDSALVAVPVSALFEKEGSTSVWVYNSGSGTISARSVKPDEILSNGIVILSEGLSAGEQVVTAGVHSLQENQQVVPIPAVSSTNIGGIL